MVTVQQRNSADAGVLATSNVAISLTTTATSGLTFYTTTGCAAPGTLKTLGVGQSQVSFSFVATKAEASSITATASGLTPATQGVLVAPNAPSSLIYNSTVQTVALGACSPTVFLLLQDQYGNSAPASADFNVNLVASNPALGLKVYSGPGPCSAGTPFFPTNFTILMGASGATFRFLADGGTGSGNLTAGTTGFGSPALSVTIN